MTLSADWQARVRYLRTLASYLDEHLAPDNGDVLTEIADAIERAVVIPAKDAERFEDAVLDLITAAGSEYRPPLRDIVRELLAALSPSPQPEPRLSPIVEVSVQRHDGTTAVYEVPRRTLSQAPGAPVPQPETEPPATMDDVLRWRHQPDTEPR